MKIKSVFAVLWTIGILSFFSQARAVLLGPEFPISTAPNNQNFPRLIYDSVNQQFLAVWEDERNQFSTYWDIYGQFINASGDLIGGDIAITTAPNWQRRPSVACDPVSQRFLVVWEDDRNYMSSYYDVYGQLIDATGGFVGGEFSIPTAFEEYQVSPSAAYDPVTQRYLVVWEDWRNSMSTWNDIYGRLISASGTFIGDDFPISAAPPEQLAPSITYDSVNQRFLVAWRDNRIMQSYIYGQIVNATGTLYGGEFFIGVAPNSQLSPALDFDPVNQDYLVAFEDFSNWPPYIFGQLITAYGTLMGGKLSIASPPNGGGAPSAAFDPVNQRFLATWFDFRSGSNYDIYGQLIRANGTFMGGNFSISNSPSDQLSPAVAFEPVTQRFLVVWADYRSMGNYDIYGRLVAQGGIATSTLPDGFIAVPYSFALQATLGTLLYTWEVTSGTLPTGLILNPSTGWISGLPITVGAYPFIVQVTDADGFTDTAALAITISPNQPPTAGLTASPESGMAPLSVTFTATASDPDGIIVEYQWDFTGDGIVDITTTIGAMVFTYTMAGKFTAGVTAVDNLGASAKAAVTITALLDIPPIVDLKASPMTGTAPLSVTFTATASDPDGSIAEYQWDFTGDGTIDLVTVMGGATFTYTMSGAFLAKVTVVDDLGASTTAYTVIDVSAPPEPGNQLPSINLVAGPTTGPPPLSVTFTATASDSDGSIVEYRWDFTGDGTVDLLTSEGSATYLYSSSGVYLAIVTAADDKGSTASAYSIINVSAQINERVIEKQGCGCTLALASSSVGLASTLALTCLPLLFAMRMKKRRR